MWLITKFLNYPIAKHILPLYKYGWIIFSVFPDLELLLLSVSRCFADVILAVTAAAAAAWYHLYTFDILCVCRLILNMMRADKENFSTSLNPSINLRDTNLFSR